MEVLASCKSSTFSTISTFLFNKTFIVSTLSFKYCDFSFSPSKTKNWSLSQMDS